MFALNNSNSTNTNTLFSTKEEKTTSNNMTSFFGKTEEKKEETKINNNTTLLFSKKEDSNINIPQKNDLIKKDSLEEEYSGLGVISNSKILNQVKNNVMKNLNNFTIRKTTDGDYHKLFQIARKDSINRRFNLTKNKKNNNISTTSIKQNKHVKKYNKNNFIQINFIISSDDYPEIHQKEFYLKFKEQTLTKNILNYIKNNLKENFKFDIDDNNLDFFLMKDESVLKFKDIFIQSGLEDGDYVHIILAKKDDLLNKSYTKINYEKYEKEREELNNLSLNENKNISSNKNIENEYINKNNIFEDDNLCPSEHIPIISKSGYNINPSLAEIARYTEEEMKHVKNFSIYNQFGRISFEDEVSLYDAKLDDIFNINHGEISIYENDIIKPKKGEGFNKPAIITLYGILPDSDFDNLNKFSSILQQKVSEFNGEFISYDIEKGGMLVYKIKNL